jgi:carbonic anhydrase/acetyltransferase-like protein (isoleucine patch superfamily)
MSVVMTDSAAWKAPLPEVEPLAVAKPRKKRAPKHDFKDGRGRVFAHRHTNGGGWVADTAKVEDSVLVDKLAQVYHHAVVTGHVKIQKKSRVCGNARLSDSVWLSHNATVCGRAVLQNECRVWHNAMVLGGRLYGSTTVYDRVKVWQNPTITDSQLSEHATVGGYAIVIKSAIQGNAHIDRDAQLTNATVNGYVLVTNNARVISSKLQMLTTYATIDRNEAAVTGQPDAYMKIKDYATVVNVEEICAYITLCGHTTVIGGRIRFRPTHVDGGYQHLQTDRQAIFPAVMVDNLSTFAAYNVPPSQRNSVMNNTAQVVRPVSMAVLTPTRRLMSLGSAE